MVANDTYPDVDNGEGQAFVSSKHGSGAFSSSSSFGTPHKPFGMVLGGGGARGLAHVGALRALNHYGYYPAALVGVSMGAIVAASYALNDRWYEDLVDMDHSGFPVIPNFSQPGVRTKFKNAHAAERAARDEYFNWGLGHRRVEWGRGVLEHLTRGKNLENGRLPVYVSATDALSGKRVVKSSGSAVDAAYASSALAGILPPFEDGPYLLIDGGYSDMAPVDVLRDAGLDCIVAINPAQNHRQDVPQNGLQMMLRAIEITQRDFASNRFSQADMVLTPEFGDVIGVLDYHYKRLCVAEGVHMVRRALPQLRRLLAVKSELQVE